jgi:hypothetical protein
MISIKLAAIIVGGARSEPYPAAAVGCREIWNIAMRANSLFVDFSQTQERADPDRLAVRIGALTIFGLSLLSWAVIVLPVFAYFHH